MGIVKFSIWRNIPSKYRGFICRCFVIVGIFSERLTDTSCQDFSLCFLGFSLFKTLFMWNVLLNSLFHQKGPSFFCFWFVSYLPPVLVLRSWVLFLKRKLSITFSVSSCLESDIYKNSEPDMTLWCRCKHWN